MQRINSSFLRQIKIATVVFIVIFMIDFVIELAQIHGNVIKTTLLGLRIETSIDPAKIFTTFALTLRVLISYLIFIISWVSIFMIVRRQKRVTVR